MSQMINKNQRLDGNTFKEVFNNGYFVSTPFFSAKFLKCSDDFSGGKGTEFNNSPVSFRKPRFAFVIPKKLVKSVVKRNFIKRRAYHALREIIQDSEDPCLMIIFARPSALQLSFVDLKKELKHLLKKVGFPTKK